METIIRIAQARKDAGLTAKELAETLGVDLSTLSNWENGRRQPTLDRLVQISDILNISISYLLGQNEQLIEPLAVVDKSMLPVLHRLPVWMRSRGWALVNAAERVLIFTDKSEIPYDSVREPLYLIPPSFALARRGVGRPLNLDTILSRERIWVEPVSSDPDLASELRGWYQPHSKRNAGSNDIIVSQVPRFVENEYGNKFYLDTYGAKWLAFETCLGAEGS